MDWKPLKKPTPGLAAKETGRDVVRRMAVASAFAAGDEDDEGDRDAKRFREAQEREKQARAAHIASQRATRPEATVGSSSGTREAPATANDVHAQLKKIAEWKKNQWQVVKKRVPIPEDLMKGIAGIQQSGR